MALDRWGEAPATVTGLKFKVRRSALSQEEPTDAKNQPKTLNLKFGTSNRSGASPHQRCALLAPRF